MYIFINIYLIYKNICICVYYKCFDNYIFLSVNFCYVKYYIYTINISSVNKLNAYILYNIRNILHKHVK